MKTNHEAHFYEPIYVKTDSYFRGLNLERLMSDRTPTGEWRRIWVRREAEPRAQEITLGDDQSVQGGR